MLFDPFKKKFDIPSVFIQFRNGERMQTELIAHKIGTLLFFGVNVSDPPEFFRIFIFWVVVLFKLID